jgi:hypothetical protein
MVSFEKSKYLDPACVNYISQMIIWGVKHGMFRRNVLPPCSGSKNKLCRKRTRVGITFLLDVRGLLPDKMASSDLRIQHFHNHTQHQLCIQNVYRRTEDSGYRAMRNSVISAGPLVAGILRYEARALCMFVNCLYWHEIGSLSRSKNTK